MTGDARALAQNKRRGGATHDLGNKMTQKLIKLRRRRAARSGHIAVQRLFEVHMRYHRCSKAMPGMKRIGLASPIIFS